jgi:exodeoxyribonuclease-3
VFRLVSLNLNGIRSAAAPRFAAWAEGVGADCMGVPESAARADAVAQGARIAALAAGTRLARTRTDST